MNSQAQKQAAVSAEEVARDAMRLSDESPSAEKLRALGGGDFVHLQNLRAGYGKTQILHDFNLFAARGKSLCLIGPNGAGKSTVLHSIFGIADRLGGTMHLNGKDIGNLSPNEKLRRAGIAYVLQDNSIFADMSVEENLMMGGYTLPTVAQAQEQTERIFAKYERLAARRKMRAGSLSGGERRLLEISRALMTNPQVLLVDEPSIGLEPRYIGMVFEILSDLQNSENKTILLVEQNAKKGLAFADIGYVLVAGKLLLADTGDNLLANPEVGRLFLGG